MLNGVDYSASGGGSSNEAYNRANAAYNQANTAYSRANTSYNRANTAYNQANSAYNRANEAYNLASSSSSSSSNCSLAQNIMNRITASNLCLGDNASTNIFNSVALGGLANAAGRYSIAIGNDSITKIGNDYSIAIGCSANAQDGYSIAIGRLSKVGDGSGSGNSIAIGNNTKVFGNYSIALGSEITVNGRSSIVIGRYVRANSNNSIAIGANSCGDNSISIGYSISMNNYGIGGIIALGASVKTNSQNTIAIGSSSQTDGGSCIAIGIGCVAVGGNSIAIGSGANIHGYNSVGLGYYAVTSSNNTIQLGNSAWLSTLSSRVALTVTSDERDKTDITEIDDGAVEFLKKIKAIRYVFNHRELYIDEENLSDEEREKKQKYGLCAYDREAHALGTKKGSRIRVGVSAQNTQKALTEVYGDSGYANLINDNLFDYDPDEIPEGVESQLSANYEGFIPFLIKAIQELDARLQTLEAANGGK